ncbi:MAG: GntP family permease [Pleomorphochaeta sp.]
MYQVFLLIASVVILILLITKFHLHAFLSLLIVSLGLGLASGMDLLEVSTTVAKGFGGTMQYIGIVIVCGVVMGEVLEQTGAAQKIANSILKLVGIKRAPVASAITGAVVSIPTFCDSGFVILNPVIKAISKVGKIPYMVLVTALMCGLLTTHTLVPPTPGPIAAAGILGADVGTVMIYGIIISIVVVGGTTIFWCNSKFIKSHYPELADSETLDEESEKDFEEKVKNAPATFLCYLPIIVPILLIIIRSFVLMYASDPNVGFAKFIQFVGTPYIALLLGCLISFILPKKLNEEVTNTWVSNAIQKSAEILLITGVAGCFGKILQATGVSNIIAEIISSTSLPGVLLPFLVSSLVLIAQGSATVALTTTAAIMVPLLGALGISPELAVISIAAGGMCGVFPQGSYFWAVTKLAGFDMKKGYVAVTATSFVMGGFALVSVLILSLFVA